MNILFVLEHYYPYIGGAEKLFNQLAEALAAKGHHVEVVTTLYDSSLPKVEVVKGVHVTRINCGNRFLFTLFSLPAIIKKARQCDLIHTTTYNAAFPAWLGGKWTGKKVIVTFHEVWGALWKRLPFTSSFKLRGFYYYEQMVLRLGFDKFIAVSDFTKEALIQNGIPAEKVLRIYNGLDYEKFAPYKHQAPDKFTYTYFGRLGISKGLDLLLPAAKIFSEKYPETQLVLIIPKQPVAMFNTINGFIDDLGLREHILPRHELTRDELYTQISQSTCVVIPSYSEGFCFVAAETVGMEVPIISSGKGALKEVVNGQHVVMESMTVEALAEALEKAYHGDWAHKKRELFLMNNSLSLYLEFYAQLNEQTITC